MTADIPAVPESIPVTDALTLIAIDERYVSDLHQLVVKNQRWLQQSLSWPAEVRSEDETRRHVQGNVNVGNTKENLIDALTCCLPYIGFPRTLNALGCVNAVIPEN